MINRNTLNIIRGSEFQIFMKPENMDAMEDDALRVTNMTREQIATFPETAVVFPTFINWINKYNKGGAGNVYTAPIPMGMNIDGYDMKILDRYCKKYKIAWDEERQQQKALSQVYSYDLLKHLWFWFESVQDLDKLKLTHVLEYMGAAKERIETAHDAMVDVKNTADIIIRIFKMQRHMTALREDGTRRLEMKGCMAR